MSHSDLQSAIVRDRCANLSVPASTFFPERPPSPATRKAMSEVERIERIASLLAKAVVAHAVEQTLTRETSVASGGVSAATPLGDSQRVINYLMLVGQATPVALREILGFSRMRLYRAVQPLLAVGRLKATGHTTTVAYTLAKRPEPEFGLN